MPRAYMSTYINICVLLDKTASTARIASRYFIPNSNRLLYNSNHPKLLNQLVLKQFSSLTIQNNAAILKLLVNPEVQKISNNITRNLIKFSFRKGKRKSVKAVTRRFYRLHWGIWIRTKAGRQKRLWRKSPPRKRRLRQHVFCNATQSRMLDKMVGAYWMKPKYYVDDPYETYHTREEYYFSAKKPRPYIPPEETK